MTISAEILKDSISPGGVRITTFLLTFPRYVLSEVNTHRAASRNSQSSRAIPFKKQMAAIRNDMVYPLIWTSNKPGMQGGEELPPWKVRLCKMIWGGTGHLVLLSSWMLSKLGLAKQYCNRPIEPWAHNTIVFTATELANFFALRYSPMAQPEICALAKAMWEAYQASTPVKRGVGEWHLPFVSEEEYEKDKSSMDRLVRKSVACCARTSYLTHDKKETTPEQNDNLYHRLVNDGHFSPLEHQAIAVDNRLFKSGNLVGWLQFRKTIPGENITEFSGPPQMKDK